MIAIQRAKGGFDDRWISYCDACGISYKFVDCYKNNIIEQLQNCEYFLWQFYQGNPKDILMAKELIFALEHIGIRVFPNFNTSWHFDDKLGQKYLLEAINAPLVPVWIFFDKNEALEWTRKSEFPKVFKLRGGAGSQNVRLAKSQKAAQKLIRKAFGKGFTTYDPLGSLKERWRRFRLGKTEFKDILEGVARFIILPPYTKVSGRERGYIYFQEYVPGNDHDIRVIVIGDKAFAIKRMVRAHDFRASGSGDILYDRILFKESTIRLSFNLAVKLKSQCIAFDYVHKDNQPLLVEISYGFSPEGYSACPGYWDKELNWHDEKFNPYGWMIEDLIKQADSKISNH